MKKLYYLRHGLSEMNLAYKFAGSTDTPLADIGREEAKIEGHSQIGLKIDIIITSPLSRAKETAEIFVEAAELHKLKPIPTVIEPLLRERNFGVLEQTRYSKTISHSLVNDNLPEGVEKWDDVVKRAEQLLAKVDKMPEENILLVGHGSIGRALKKVTGHDDWEVHIPNTSIFQLY